MAKSNVGKKPIISEEEYTTNKVLTVFSVCLLGVLVLMILQRLLNYGSTWATGMVVTKVLLGVGVLGVIWSLFLFAQEKSGKRSGKNRIVCGRNALLVSLVMIVIMAAILYIGPAPIKALYVLLPVLAVYYLVYHSYQREFFVIAADCGAAVALMWLAHRAQATTHFTSVAYVALAVMAVIAVVQIIVSCKLRAAKGKVKRGGKAVETGLSRNAYTMLIVTPIVMTVLTAAAVFAPAYTLIAMGAAAAYLFVTAVYYTVKLM